MRNSVVPFVATLLLGAGACAPGQQSEMLVIHNVQLLSPERADPLDNAFVVIADGRITEIGTGEPEPTHGAERLDGRGHYLMPGLIDSHTHLAGVPGFPFPTPSHLESLAAAYFEQLPRSYLYFGYTTVIDLNVVDRDLIRRLERAAVRPEVFDCDGALVLANGYPMVFEPPGVARFRPHRNFLYDPRQADAIPERYRPEDHTPAAVVARVADAGGICVKTHWEDGFGAARDWPTPTPEMIGEVIAEAHDRGLTVTMHANAYEAWRFAAESGVDAIVHGMWNWDGLSGGDPVPTEIAALLDEVVANEIGFQPTAQVMAGLRALFDAEFLDDPQLNNVLPAALIDWYRSDEARSFPEEIRQDFDGLPDARVRRIIDGILARGDRVTRYLADRDGRLLFGTDTPSSPTYGNPPGYNGLLEMRRLVGAGVSLRKLFESATIDNATAFHIDDRYGTVQPGKVASLLLVRENPLESVEAYDSIETVVVRGEVIPRDRLAASSSGP